MAFLYLRERSAGRPVKVKLVPSNTALRRPRFVPLRSPLSRKPLGRFKARLRQGGALSALLFTGMTAFAQPVELPRPPKGFHWERATEIKGAFLTPDGWFFRREKKQDTYAYFVTRENIARGDGFLVGLTVNVMPHIQGKNAVEYARQFIAAFPQGKKLHKSWDASMASLGGNGCLVEDETTTMHTIMVGNPRTNTLYLFIFEAPTNEWPEAWRSGQEIMRLLRIDDEI